MAATEKNLGASGVIFDDRRDFYVDPQVTKELWTDVAPFTTMVSNQELRSVPDPVFKMFEHRNPWIKQEFQAVDDGVTIPDDDTGLGIEVDSIYNLASSPDSSYIGLVVEVYDSTKATFKGVAVVTGVPEAVPVVGTPLLFLLRGGVSVGQLTLTRFYSAHTFLLPVATAALMLTHFLMIRKQGISGPL